MNLVFPGTKSSEIEFKLNIAGTASVPTKVLAVIEQDGISMAFDASRNADEMWHATISNLGKIFKHGAANFSVNVILNDKIFVPLKNQVLVDLENAEEALLVADITNVEIVSTSPIESEAPIMPPQFEAEKLQPANIVPPVASIKPPTVEAKAAPASAPKPFALLKTVEPVRPVRKPAITSESVTQPTSTLVETKPQVSGFKIKRIKVIAE